MTLYDDKTGEYILEARRMTYVDQTCLCCGRNFKTDQVNGIYGMSFCKSCIKEANGKMPTINFTANPEPKYEA